MQILPEKKITTQFPQNCVRPLVFESGYDGYPYCTLGTGFFVANGQQVYFVTAAHCLRDRGEETLMISTTLPDGEIIKIKSKYTVKADSASGLEELDIVLIGFDVSNEGLASVHASAVQPMRGHSDEDFFSAWKAAGHDWNSKVPVVAYGYPSAGQIGVDYEKKSIKVVLRPVKLLLKGESIVPGCYEVDVQGDISDLHGMSGSPIFMKLPEGFILFGMLVRSSSGIGHFVRLSVIQECLALARRDP